MRVEASVDLGQAIVLWPDRPVRLSCWWISIRDCKGCHDRLADGQLEVLVLLLHGSALPAAIANSAGALDLFQMIDPASNLLGDGAEDLHFLVDRCATFVACTGAEVRRCVLLSVGVPFFSPVLED